MHKLSIIIPVYNEEKTVSEIINKVKLVKIPIQKEIIVVNDGSSDKTLEILKKIKGIKLISHEKNLGKGAVVKTGLKHSTGDIIIIQDADLEYDPNEYSKLIEPILNNMADVVYGSRELNKENKRHSGFMFYLGGKGMTFMTNLLYPGARLTDEPTCYKVFNADVLKGIDLKCTRFEFCPEVTAKILKKGIKIHELPITYNPRNKKQGKKIKFIDGIIGVWTLLKYRFVD